MLNSDYKQLCPVRLPYQGRQHYMHEFDLAAPVMPPGYEDYLDPVLSLTRAADATTGTAYMTVDEKIVEAGCSQRRPKPHVDGVFRPNVQGWGHDIPRPGWNHTCNDICAGPLRRMPVIVAASAVGCRVWRGQFDAEPASDGDLSHLALDEGEIVPAGVGYLLSPDCVHESMIQSAPVARSFLRIALPVEFGFAIERGEHAQKQENEA